MASLNVLLRADELAACKKTSQTLYEHIMDYALNREQILATPTSDAERAGLTPLDAG